MTEARKDQNDAARGSVLAMAAFSFLSFGDAFTKSLGGRVGMLEIGLAIAVLGSLSIPALKPREQRWSDALAMRQPWAILARAAAGIGSGACGIYAFTHIPLAQAYGLIFLAPFITVVLAGLVLGERTTRSALPAC